MPTAFQRQFLAMNFALCIRIIRPVVTVRMSVLSASNSQYLPHTLTCTELPLAPRTTLDVFTHVASLIGPPALAVRVRLLCSSADARLQHDKYAAGNRTLRFGSVRSSGLRQGKHVLSVSFPGPTNACCLISPMRSEQAPFHTVHPVPRNAPELERFLLIHIAVCLLSVLGKRPPPRLTTYLLHDIFADHSTMIDRPRHTTPPLTMRGLCSFYVCALRDTLLM